MMTPRQLLWILANRCYTARWGDEDAATTLDLDSRRPDDKAVLESLQEMGQLIANDKEAGQLDANDEKRSCWTCMHKDICVVFQDVRRTVKPVLYMFHKTPRNWAEAFDVFAEACNRYVNHFASEEQEAET